jgi:hypothetical protein
MPYMVFSARICKSVRNPGIDSNESIPPAYVAWQNRILGSLNVYKFGLSVVNRKLMTDLNYNSFGIKKTWVFKARLNQFYWGNG